MGLMVQNGGLISKELEKHAEIFSPTFSGLIAVGERTGNLVGNLEYLTEFYERDVNDFVNNLSVVIEPILLVFLGVTVGFIAVSIILPIYKLTSSFAL
jgi:type IV pilus assembly protein PilC